MTRPTIDSMCPFFIVGDVDRTISFALLSKALLVITWVTRIRG